MNFIMKAMIKSQLKGVPEEQIDMIITLVEKNPEFFKKIAEEIKAKSASGVSQQEAAMEVFKAHEVEIRTMLEKK